MGRDFQLEGEITGDEMKGKILFALLLGSILFGCLQTDPMIGCWKTVILGTEIRMTFNSDGTFTYYSFLGTLAGTWERLNSTTVKISYTNPSGETMTENIVYDEKTKTIYSEKAGSGMRLVKGC